MVIAIILLGILQVFGAVLALKLTEKRVKIAINQQKEVIYEEFSKLAQGQPCQSATILNSIGQLIGSQAGASARAGLMQSLGSAKRLVNTAETEATIEGINQVNPTIGGLLGGLGKNKAKGLLGNPLIQLAVQGLLNQKSEASANLGGTPTGNNGQKSFSL
jgi:hypothetical protein